MYLHHRRTVDCWRLSPLLRAARSCVCVCVCVCMCVLCPCPASLHTTLPCTAYKDDKQLWYAPCWSTEFYFFYSFLSQGPRPTRWKASQGPFSYSILIYWHDLRVITILMNKVKDQHEYHCLFYIFTMSAQNTHVMIILMEGFGTFLQIPWQRVTDPHLRMNQNQWWLRWKPRQKDIQMTKYKHTKLLIRGIY